MDVVHRNDEIVWFFRRKRTGKMVPALDGQGYDRKTAVKVLKELQAGDYNCLGEVAPAGDHYVPCTVNYIETKL